MESQAERIRPLALHFRLSVHCAQGRSLNDASALAISAPSPSGFATMHRERCTEPVFTEFTRSRKARKNNDFPTPTPLGGMAFELLYPPARAERLIGRRSHPRAHSSWEGD